MADCAAHVALAALTALGWIGLGAVVLARVRPSGDVALEILNRFGIGAVALALLTFAAGWLHLLYAQAYVPLIVLLAAVGTVVTARNLRGSRRPVIRTWPRWQLALLVLLVGFVLLDVFATCAPITSADALSHHAAAPKLYEQAHRIYELPWSWQSYQPHTVEMLILDGFLLWNSVQGAFAPLLLALGALAALTFGSARLLGRGGGLLVGAVFFAQAFTVWIATSTFVEPGIVLLLALAAWNAMRFVREDRIDALVFAGVFAGACAGVKYPGAATAVLLALAGGALFRRQLTLRRIALFAVPALAIALPWYVQNWILTGNPVYPLLFGGANAEADRAARQLYANYGFGTSPADALLLPFRLLGDAKPFDRGEYVSPLFLIFAPLAFLDPRWRKPAAAVWAASAVLTATWFFEIQHIRYLVGLFPFLAVLAVVGMRALAESGRLGRLLTIAVVTGALASGAAISAVYGAQFISVVTGRESEGRYLEEKTPYYAGTEWLNRNLPADAHVALGHVLDFYLDRPYVAWTSDVLPTTAGATATRVFVHRWHLSYAAVLYSNRGARATQLRYLHARLIARIPVHTVVSRTLNELGPPDTMLVYKLPRTAR